MMNSQIRLNKFIAYAGIASRRKADELIAGGKVKVNGEWATTLGVMINPDHDIVTVNGKTINTASEIVTYAINKPVGYISTASDELNRPSVISLIPETIKIYPAGRLDADSQGLLILTNDGDLTYRLTHPKYHVPKTYQITVDRKLTRQELYRIRQGLQLKNFKSAPSQIEQTDTEDNTFEYQMILHQGKNRQIRRMMSALNTQVIKLERIQIGLFHLTELEGQTYLKLDSEQIKKLLNRN